VRLRRLLGIRAAPTGVIPDPRSGMRVIARPIPGAVRCVALRRVVLGSILDKYYDPRGVVLDLLGNLHKERLADHVPGFLDLANATLRPPLTEPEVRRYYASDARTWAALQRLRRLDRLAHRALGRTYPFLLPGPIER